MKRIGRLILIALCILAVGTAPSAPKVSTDPPPPKDGNRWQRFRDLDTNRDNRLTRDEFPNRMVFDRFDRNSDGVITLDELNRTPAMASRPQGQEGSTMPDEAKVRIERDISYVPPDENPSDAQRLDLYAPRNAKKAPVMVYVHGGGWKRGDKMRVGNKATFFTNNGWLFASVNYRLLPEGEHPNNARDVARAIAWVHDHAPQVGGDPERLFIMGHSAGAHLVSLVATDERHLKAARKGLAIVKGVIELDTNAFDITRLMQGTGGRNPIYRDAFGETKADWEKRAPAGFVAPGKGIPPFLLVVANRNQSKLDQSRRFAERLKQAGIASRLVEAPDKTHGTLNQDIGSPDDAVTQAMMEFIAKTEGE